jgi:hypothetical protein
MGVMTLTMEMLAAKFEAISRIWMSGSGGC